jgi:hypothetical protein
MSDDTKKNESKEKRDDHGKMTYEKPQDEGGKVAPDEDPARRTKSGKPPLETNPKKKSEAED